MTRSIIGALVLAWATASAGGAGDLGVTPADFKVKMVAVGVLSADDTERELKPQAPQSRLVVTPGNVAVFRLAYDFPDNVKSRLYLSPNFAEGKLDENPFGTSGSGIISGKGQVDRMIILGAGGDDPYAQSLRLRSVRVTGEIEAQGGARRNNSFFICDMPVDVLFANKGREDGEDATVLDPSPAPAPDPTLGVIARDAAQSTAPQSSTPRGFTDNLDAALAQAKAEGKLVYACFSGSDWCVWCQKLEREVLSHDAFLAGVTNDFVLVFVDSPSDKSVLSDHAKAANPALVKKYEVKGYPTALVLDGDGKKVGETGYRKGGPAAYAQHLMSLRSAKPCRGGGSRK